MSGHNKWSQIKNQKSATDKKRGVLFSKILNAIAIAARAESYTPAPNGKLGEGASPRLRSLIEKAKENNVPQENIERAIKKSSAEKELEELTIEAYGPGSIAMLIECITDNRNRTTNEIRHLLSENEAKMAEMGSVRWAFAAPEGRASPSESGRDGYKPKFPQEASAADQEKIKNLIQKLEERDDVQRVVTNLKF